MQTRRSTLRARSTAIAALTCLACLQAHATVTAANWTSETQGSLTGTSFSVAGAQGGNVATMDYHFATPAFSPALPSGQTALAYSAFSDWSVSFAAPVTDLLLYAVYWRGTSGTYTFSQAVQVVSSSGGGSLSSDGLTYTAGSGWNNVVFKFAGSVSALSVDATPTNPNDYSQQALTFGVEQAVTSVPEPESYALMLAGLGVVGWVGKRRQRTQPR